MATDKKGAKKDTVEEKEQSDATLSSDEKTPVTDDASELGLGPDEDGEEPEEYSENEDSEELEGSVVLDSDASAREEIKELISQGRVVSKPTRINKLVLQGFKSFAKHTEILLGDNFNCVIGPNGAGKCVTGDSYVTLADGSVIAIEELVNRRQEKECFEMDDGFVSYGDGTQVMGLNLKTLRIEPMYIEAFVKRTAPENLLRIQTRSGRVITATEYHPLFVLENDQVVPIRSDAVREGIRIAVPREVTVERGNLFFDGLVDSIEADDEIYVPFDMRYVDVIKTLKKKQGTTWKLLSEEIGVPYNALKGLLDNQSINFAYLVAILRHGGMLDRDIAGLITRVKAKNQSKCISMLWENSCAFSRFMGYLISEGRISSQNGHIWFTNGDEDIVADYVRLLTSLFGITPLVREYKANCYDVIASSSVLQKLLVKFGMTWGRTEHKTITNFLLRHSSPTEFGALLDGIYSGDGYVSDGTVELTTKSADLAYKIQHIFSMLGIQSVLKDVVKVATNSGFSGTYKMLTVYGRDNVSRFARYVRLTHKKKQVKLDTFVSKETTMNPNLDLMDVNGLVKKVTTDLGLSAKKLKKRFPKLDAYVYNQCTPSRGGVQELITEVFSTAGSCSSLQQLQTIAFSDVYWDEVVCIEHIKAKETWVYDLCVSEHHNFIANNVIVHNSNIMDALCFVLGKSSSREMRAEKSANLIYNGGKNKQPAKKGEVSIYFDNSDGAFPTEEKEVKVSRIVKPTGQSVYRINDKTRTRTQIIDLLSFAKINPDGYNVILQGDIVRLVEMRPEDRRELIEDIAGISIYEEKKNKALNELNKVEDRMRETDIVLAERESYLKELKKDRDQALKYKDMSDKIKENKASYLKHQINRKEEEKNTLAEKQTKQQKKFDEMQKGIDGLKKDNDGHKKRVDELEHEIEEKGEVEQVKLNKEIESLKVSIARSESRLESVKNEVDKVKQRREDLKNNSSETKDRIKGLEETQSRIKKEISTKEKEKKRLESQLTKLRGKHKLDDIGDIDKQVQEIDHKADELQKEIHTMRENQHEEVRGKDRLLNEIKLLDDRLNKIVDVEREYKAKKSELESKRKAFKKATLELNKCLDGDAASAAHLTSLRGKVHKAQEELAKLKARDASIQETTRGDIAITRILEMKDKMSGIYGTIADLGNVPSRFALALEIAAASKIKSIVVESDKVASQCISYLKQKRLGTAAFLPLNKIKSREPSEQAAKLSKAKGSHGLALDLIEFDPKFKRAFRYVFSDTIVVDSIDVAIRLGVGKAKFVSLDGDVAEPSGAMHGGFRQKKRGGLGFKEKDLTKDIEKYESMISNLNGDISLHLKRRTENEDVITKLRAQKAELEGEIIKQETALGRETSDAGAIDNQKKDISKQVEASEKRLESFISSISVKNSELAKLKIEKQKLRNKINQLNNPRLIAEIQTYDQKIKEMDESLIQLRSELKAIETQITTIYGPEQDKMQQILKQLDKDEASFKEEHKALGDEISSQKKILVEKEKAAQEFYARFKGLFAEANKLKETIQKNEFEMERKRNDGRQIEIQLNTVSLKIAEFGGQLGGLKAEFDQYEGVKLDLNKSEEEYKREIQKFERMREQIGNVNLRALEIYDDAERHYNDLVEKKKTLLEEKEDVVSMMNEIEGKKKELFMQTYNNVNDHFQKFFTSITTKGAQANLVLDNEEDPFEGGVRINVKISGNKFLDIRSLSGGEKTLTALAFIFAIQEYEPASFYILDEVDAALDKSNALKLGQLIRDYSSKAQYLIISHNDAVINEADALFGISMNTDGISQVVSLKI